MVINVHARLLKLEKLEKFVKGCEIRSYDSSYLGFHQRIMTADGRDLALSEFFHEMKRKLK